MTGSSSVVVAIGWATVELDRAAVELAALLLPGSTFDAAPDCVLLGARCRVGRLGRPDQLTVRPDGDHPSTWPPIGSARLVVLLEPNTEGRLARTLARYGESWCATWEPVGAHGRAAAGPLSVTRPGPIGDECLVLDAPPDRPHRLLVLAATIGP